jgi:hypothetical protein
LPEWLIERGIGETRMARIEQGEIVDAQIRLDGQARPGEIRPARLKRAGMPALAVDAGEEYLLPKGAPGATEGAEISIEVTREKIPGSEPWKRPLARYVADGGLRTAAPQSDGEVLTFPCPDDPLAAAGWDDLMDEARSGMVKFAGGELRISPTPAMTLIDVDGTLPAEQLAINGASAAAKAIRRLDIGGSIGIDLPTTGSKAARQAAASAIDEILEQPFERTAVNGFGFVQIVRPRLRASLVELAADRANFEARALLRRAGRETAATRLAVHPAVAAALKTEWLEALGRQIGGMVSLRTDPGLTMSAGYAEPL